MFVQRMMNDPTFRERVLTEKRGKDELGCDVTAEDWQQVLADCQKQSMAEMDDSHERIQEIRVIAQALAFREATIDDISPLHRLIIDAYAAESTGHPEGFRTEPVLSKDTLHCMIEDPDCHWILAEAPRGMNAVEDGTILGCCCFSVGNAAAEGKEKSGAVRVLAVLPAFLGLLVGRRILRRVEHFMTSHGCAQCLACVPDSRESVIRWLLRRQYEVVNFAEFPQEMSKDFTKKIKLAVLRKLISSAQPFREYDPLQVD